MAHLENLPMLSLVSTLPSQHSSVLREERDPHAQPAKYPCLVCWHRNDTLSNLRGEQFQISTLFVETILVVKRKVQFFR